MFDNAVRFFLLAMLTENLDLKRGSSKHGNTFLAYTGWKFVEIIELE